MGTLVLKRLTTVLNLKGVLVIVSGGKSGLQVVVTPPPNVRTPMMTPENLRRLGIIIAVLVIVYGGLKMVGIIPSG